MNWVRENLPAVTAGLATVSGKSMPIAPTHVAGAIVTLYPSFATYYTKDLPCVSIGEFFDAWDDKGDWSFPNGMFAT